MMGRVCVSECIELWRRRAECLKCMDRHEADSTLYVMQSVGKHTYVQHTSCVLSTRTNPFSQHTLIQRVRHLGVLSSSPTWRGERWLWDHVPPISTCCNRHTQQTHERQQCHHMHIKPSCALHYTSRTRPPSVTRVFLSSFTCTYTHMHTHTHKKHCAHRHACWTTLPTKRKGNGGQRGGGRPCW